MSTIELPDFAEDAEVSVFNARPGDTIVLTCPNFLTVAQGQLIKGMIEEMYPGVKCLVLANGLSVDCVLAADAQS